MKYLADYTVEFAGELFAGTCPLSGNQLPEEGDTVRLPVKQLSTLATIERVRIGAGHFGVQHVELTCSIRGGSDHNALEINARS